MSIDLLDMSEEQLREELVKVRGDRAGKARQKRQESKVKRVSQGVRERKVRKNVEAEKSADWV